MSVGVGGGVFFSNTLAKLLALIGYTPANVALAPRIIGSKGTAASVTGTTSETQLAAIEVPAGLMGTNGILRITTLWSYTNSVNNKTLRVRFSGASGTALGVVVTTTATAQFREIIYNNNSASAQKFLNAFPADAFTATALATPAANTALATTVYISGQLANTGETITLEGYTVEFIPAVG